MSTKNLSRTIIEGGRRKYNKWERRHSNKALRAKVREYMHNIAKDIDYSDEDLEPVRDKVYKDFDDKLAPIYRWLHAQEGRLWDDVKSEICQKFDTRTTAGRHIIYDHLLNSVEEVPDLDYGRGKTITPENWTTTTYRNDFYVDEDGCLRAKTRLKRKKYYLPYKETPEIAEWLNGRIIGIVGGKVYWFEIVTKGSYTYEWRAAWNSPFFTPKPKYYYYSYYHSLVYVRKESVPIYKDGKIVDRVEEWREPFYYKFKKLTARQDKELSKEDLEYWNALAPYYKDKILEWSPLNPNPPKTGWW